MYVGVDVGVSYLVADVYVDLCTCSIQSYTNFLLQAREVYEVKVFPYKELKGSKCPEGVDATNKEVNPAIITWRYMMKAK